MEQLLLFGDDEEYDPDPSFRRKNAKRPSAEDIAFRRLEKMVSLCSGSQMKLFTNKRTCASCGAESVFESITDSDGWIAFEMTGVGTVRASGFACSIACSLDLKAERKKPIVSMICETQELESVSDDLMSIF